MIVLSLDSAMNGCSAGVYCTEQEHCLASEVLEMSRGQAEHLVPMISRVLEQGSLQYKDVNAIAVTHGPGAFTGIRVALSTAKAFALSLDVPVVGVCTFEAVLRTYLKAHSCEPYSHFTVVLETKRDDFYVRHFERKRHSIVAASDGEALFSKDIHLESPDKTLIIGDTVVRLQSSFSGSDKHYVFHEMKMPSPEVIAQTGYAYMKENKTIRCFPVYLRDPSINNIL